MFTLVRIFHKTFDFPRYVYSIPEEVLKRNFTRDFHIVNFFLGGGEDLETKKEFT